MHALLGALYEAAGQLARGLAVVAPAGDAKWLRAVRARKGVRTRWTAWAGARRDAARPLLWVHAPSVGEGLMARPVLALARARRPDVQVAYSFFSPSAERFARGLVDRGLADAADYLPFDTRGDASALLDVLRPRALVFSKLDVWPTLVGEAAARGVKLGLISASLAEGSSRRGGPASRLLRETYARLDRVGAVDQADAARLVALGVRRTAIRVTGDTRYDQALARAQGVDRAGALLAPFAAGSPRFTLVAGSTWPADETHLLAAWQRLAVAEGARRARLVVAPHEPDAAHLAPIERWAAGVGLSLARLDAPGAADADVVLVDRVGVLAELYAVADAAFVGGGFHAAGLHSVVEPAAFGVPVLFGPRHGASRDAALLLAAGGAASVSSADAIAAHLGRWRAEPGARDAAGRAALAVAESGLGAAGRSWELVAELLEGRV